LGEERGGLEEGLLLLTGDERTLALGEGSFCADYLQRGKSGTVKYK